MRAVGRTVKDDIRVTTIMENPGEKVMEKSWQMKKIQKVMEELGEMIRMIVLKVMKFSSSSAKYQAQSE